MAITDVVDARLEKPHGVGAVQGVRGCSLVAQCRTVLSGGGDVDRDEVSQCVVAEMAVEAGRGGWGGWMAPPLSQPNGGNWYGLGGGACGSSFPGHSPGGGVVDRSPHPGCPGWAGP